MPLTAYPGLLAGQGAPFFSVLPLLTSGKVFFVNSGIGRSGNTGDDPLRPMATIMQAYAKCRADKGDYVIAMPGHAESVIGAAGINLATSGVRVIGWGDGADQPTITLTTAVGASIDVNASNNTLSGFVIDATGVDAITAAVNVKATYFSFLGNTVILANASGQATLGILTNGSASYMKVQGCSFIDTTTTGAGTAGTTAAIRITGAGNQDIQIGGMNFGQGNYFYGLYTATIGAIQGLTNDTFNIRVLGNIINNLSTNASAKTAVFTAGSTGTVGFNSHCIIGTGTAPLTGAGLNNAGPSYYTSSVNVTTTPVLY